MIVQLNTCNIVNEERYNDKLTLFITEQLRWYNAYFTIINAFIQYEYDIENKQSNKCCVLEAGVAGMKPLIVTNYSDTYTNAIDGAVHKLKSALETRLSHKRDKERMNYVPFVDQPQK